MQQLDSSIIIIHGHSDSQQFLYVKSLKRNKQLNHELSIERATNIAAALIYRGISEKSIKIQGHGNQSPLQHPLVNPSVLAFQRRVEIEVMPIEFDTVIRTRCSQVLTVRTETQVVYPTIMPFFSL